jgi:hypothetical protein
MCLLVNWYQRIITVIFLGLYPYVVPSFYQNTKSKIKNYHCGIGAITDFIENSVLVWFFIFCFVSQPSPEITQSLFVGRTFVAVFVQLLWRVTFNTVGGFILTSNLGRILQIRKSNEITFWEARYIMLLKKSCICLF